jgi:hypothetical protein
MLPKLEERPEMHAAAKRTMQRLLEHTLREFETLTHNRNGVVDTTRWRALSKAQAAQNGQHDDQVTVYSERECGATSTDLAYVLQADAANDSTLAALTPSAVLMAGRAPAKVENIMYALGGAHSQQGLALFAGLMYDDIADCGVLHAVEAAADEQETSCGFLGYKYVVKRSVASNAKLVRHRDAIYLEYTGYTQSSSGERLGFHLEHSVDVPGFPDLHDRNSSRVRQSVRYIFRQKSDRILEVFMLGNLELAGVLNVGGVGVGGSNGGGGSDLFSISKLQQCAETRRLTLMVRRRRERIEVLQMSATHRNKECYLCHRTKRFFSGAMLAECDVCGLFVCSKCRNDKKLFVHDPATNGLLGKFQRAQTCKTCVLAAGVEYAPPPMHMSVAQQVSRNQGAGAAGSGSMSERRYSGSSGSRTSSVGERLDASRADSEFHSYRQGPVYTFSEVDEEELKRPRREPRLDQVQQREPSALSGALEASQSVTSLLSSQMLGRLREHERTRPSPGPQKREPPPSTTPPLPVSIAKARGRSGTSSSNSSASSDDSNSSRGRRRGIYLTPPNPSKLYQEEYQRRRERGATHPRGHHQVDPQEQQRRQKPTHRPADQVVPQSNHRPPSRDNALTAYHRRQLPRATFDQSDRELANPYAYSNSYSGPSSAISITAKRGFPQFPHSGRGLQRTTSTPMASSSARPPDLVAQMMELNMKAESTFNATQRNGVFLSKKIQAGQW